MRTTAGKETELEAKPSGSYNQVWCKLQEGKEWSQMPRFEVDLPKLTSIVLILSEFFHLKYRCVLPQFES